MLRVRALSDVDCHIFHGQFAVVKIGNSVIFLLSALVSGRVDEQACCPTPRGLDACE